MAHTAIYGGTDTGKTGLAKMMCDARAKTRCNQIALDPLISEWNKKCIVVTTFSELTSQLSRAQKNGLPNYVYVDEADTQLSVGARENHWLLLRGKHYTAGVTIMTQYPKLVAPAVRGQCSTLFCFQLGKTAARELAEQYACPEIELIVPGLRKGVWVKVSWKNEVKTLEQFTFPK